MPLKTIHEEIPSLNMTPMIDIVFLLIIFFMAGTKFSEMEHSLKLHLPQVISTVPLSDVTEKISISVFPDGTIGFRDKIVGIEELSQQLKAAVAEDSRIGVEVRGDERATHGQCAAVYMACKNAGIRILSIPLNVTQKPGG